jgi:aerobic carbon-monoxide dehydrogenase medium subunit
MKPGRFDLHTPQTLDAALELLARHGAEAKVLAGGQSLVPAMSFRLATPAVLVDINRIPGLDRLRVEGAELVVEMLVRHRALERPPLDDPLATLLGRTARLVGHLPIRVRGTFAGSLAHGDPAAEWAMLALALDATIVVRSAARERRLAASGFFEGPFTTALADDEIITEVRLPLLRRAGSAVLEKSQTAGDFATVAVLAVVTVDGDRIASARLAIAGAQGRPTRAHAAEAALVGAPARADSFAAAARTAAGGVDPVTDAVASSDYRRHLVEILARRALEQAALEAAA